MLAIIRLAFWDNQKAMLTVTEEEYTEMKKHAISALPAGIFRQLSLSPELYKKWQTAIIQQVAYYVNYCHAQTELPITVPYVILKGTSAAQYYPYPQYRAMGDIDIMTRREDFDTACRQLAENGYQIMDEIYKEAHLTKNGITIDLHRQFASLNNSDYAKYLDDLIIESINPTHVLPDMINGLVLLNHINQHLEGGLGLRQIIDWMMFVDKCLPDEKWSEFGELAKAIELEKLAIACTRMCEMYLGLPPRKWCANADTALCEQLMDYVMSCGNFGNKKKSDASISENVFAYAGTPKDFFKLLQNQGLKNWKTAREHKALRPFAWIYQLFRYASRGMKRDHAVSKMKAEYAAARKKMAMFDALGIKTTTKGLIVYKDGKYVKE